MLVVTLVHGQVQVLFYAGFVQVPYSTSVPQPLAELCYAKCFRSMFARKKKSSFLGISLGYGSPPT